MSILGAILAGGKSERFGSDKAAACYQGKALIEHVIEALQPQVSDLVIAGREHPGIACVPDRPAPNMGPLAGLAGALGFAQAQGHDYVLTAGVDSMGLAPDLKDRLSPAPAYVDSQPIIGLWPVDILPVLDALLASDERHSMLYFIEKIGARAVHLKNPPANINSAADLAKLEQMP
jgi:molybdenum cofactor guanylyltransferase